VVVAVAYPIEQVAETLRVGPKPGRLCDWADGFALLVFEEELDVAGVVGGGGGAGFGHVFDVVGAVVVLSHACVSCSCFDVEVGKLPG